MTTRILSTVVLIIAIVILPYWLYVPAIVAAIIYFRFYWEGLFLGFGIDLLYGAGGGILGYPFALSALVLILISLPLRERLRFNV